MIHLDKVRTSADNNPAYWINTSLIFNTNLHLKSLGHPVSEADGELLHLGDLQPLLLCLVLRASFHHHLEEKGSVKASQIHRDATGDEGRRKWCSVL